MRDLTIYKYNIKQKKLINSFSNVYGINKSTLRKLKQFLGCHENISFNLLSFHTIQRLKLFFESPESTFFLIDKLRKTQNSIKFLIQLRNYKGLRHQRHLPVRGQRTHSNSKTCKRVYFSQNTIKSSNINKISIIKKKTIKKKK